MTDHGSHETHKWKDAPADFATHVATMPRWHKAVLALGVVLLVAGAVGWVMSRAKGAAVETRTVVRSTPAPPASSGGTIPRGSSGFINGDQARQAGEAPQTVTTTTTEAAPPDWIGKASPEVTKVGGSVVAGFVVGWLFRAFLKTMAFLALLAGAGLFALSYFGVLDVNVGALREHGATAAQWLTAHADKLKDVVVSHLPSTGGGALGACLGFRRG
jgi:uncharacterized membrane protein (Fun14 family)